MYTLVYISFFSNFIVQNVEQHYVFFSEISRIISHFLMGRIHWMKAKSNHKYKNRVGFHKDYLGFTILVIEILGAPPLSELVTLTKNTMCVLVPHMHTITKPYVAFRSTRTIKDISSFCFPCGTCGMTVAWRYIFGFMECGRC